MQGGWRGSSPGGRRSAAALKLQRDQAAAKLARLQQDLVRSLPLTDSS